VKKAPWFWIIGGCNGAGKTTFAMEYLPTVLRTKDFVNADLIAAGLSPLDPSRAPIQAGKILLGRVRELLKAKQTFAVESTLSGNALLKLARSAKQKGWKVGLVYLWLSSDALALKRVADRVKMGGHTVPEATIRRRRKRGLTALPRYQAASDRWLIFENSGESPKLVAAHSDEKTTVQDVAVAKVLGVL
jgi:predicted ABC-type ATPase